MLASRSAFTAAEVIVMQEDIPISEGDAGTDCLLRNRFVVPASEVEPHIKHLKADELHSFLMSLVEPASTLARPPISGFCVGAVGLGASGAIYVGVNLEFQSVPLNCSIHAEQCLLVNCLLNGETGIKVLAVSEAPCGHCRQFYSELRNVDDVRFVFGTGSHYLHSHPETLASNGMNGKASQKHREVRATRAYSIDQLLPARFGPSDLMTDGQEFPLLLAPRHNPVSLAPSALQQVEEYKANGETLLAQAAEVAQQWAQKSYSPYTNSPSGAALVTKSGRVYGGCHIESAAFNPSLSPFHSAWVAAVTDHIPSLAEVEAVVLAQLPSAPVQHLDSTAYILKAACPDARVISLDLEKTGKI